MELADRIVVMRAGRIEQVGTPAEVYAAPASSFVYGFLGQANQIECRIASGAAATDSTLLAEGLDLPDGPAAAWFRPHQVDLMPDGPALEGDLIDLTVIGARVKATLKFQGRLITAELAGSSNLALGPCRWRPREVRIYPV